MRDGRTEAASEKQLRILLKVHVLPDLLGGFLSHKEWLLERIPQFGFLLVQHLREISEQPTMSSTGRHDKLSRSIAGGEWLEGGQRSPMEEGKVEGCDRREGHEAEREPERPHHHFGSELRDYVKGGQSDTAGGNLGRVSGGRRGYQSVLRRRLLYWICYLLHFLYGTELVHKSDSV
eukprot:2332819-Rhodomonas_salina.3